ncbi:DUF982 domain-containing protein [Nitratireductor sp. ZSWI3]|uniref:DUF982 domain-containing protein n=1 Tax=Nitratireductor sp. ZSWI3 TaxID=2966359 RepID=UPI00214F6374|nr:DUF982 domain-containing protein [Nitratireductor sp. ZSWI3]MCR4267766.1 DUF982 domain-containing protein [Nitratireductor sp. ZSWI3]
MGEGWFARPVPISVGIAGDIRYVSSARQAVGMLSGSWRETGSAKHQAALLACQRAMSGEMPTESARSAFVDAASEARVLFE